MDDSLKYGFVPKDVKACGWNPLKEKTRLDRKKTEVEKDIMELARKHPATVDYHSSAWLGMIRKIDPPLIESTTNQTASMKGLSMEDMLKHNKMALTLKKPMTAKEVGLRQLAATDRYTKILSDFLEPLSKGKFQKIIEKYIVQQPWNSPVYTSSAQRGKTTGHFDKAGMYADYVKQLRGEQVEIAPPEPQIKGARSGRQEIILGAYEGMTPMEAEHLAALLVKMAKQVRDHNKGPFVRKMGEH